MRNIVLILVSLFMGKVVAMEPAKAIVLQSNNSKHVGFTLFHPDFGANSGDCVFVIAPKDPELFDSKEVSLLLDAKESGEHQWFRSGDEVIVSLNGNETFRYLGNGKLVHAPSNTELGVWFPAPAKQ